jgi:steroid 5-alpha reductase family enzyme
VVSGLWAWSRHPNFAAEQAVWALIYQWGCLASDTVYNWTLVGAVSYLLLFQGSTWFTELITARKYPNYEEYQQRVGKFIPRFNSNLPGDLSDEKSQLEIESKISKDAKVKKSRK